MPTPQTGPQFTWVDWVSIAGTVISFIGLVITLRVQRNLNSIKQQFMVAARVPELTKDIREIYKQ